MTTATLHTQAQLSELSSKELKAIAKELHVKDWWNLRKADLIEGILKCQEGNCAEATPEVTEVAPEVVEVAPEVTEAAPKATKKARKEKQPKAPKVVREWTISQLNEADQEFLLGFAQTTADTCADPGRCVVKRTILIEFIQSRLPEVALNAKVFNQLIVMASRKLPKMPLTINGASRFNYLLAEGDTKAAIMVTDWILANPECIEVAQQMAEDQAKQGRLFVARKPA